MPTIKKALVTGGSGFLGSHIVEELVKKNFKVIVLDIQKPKTKNVVFVKNKNFSLKSLKKITKKVDYVFHLSGVSDVNKVKNNSIYTIENNILNTTKLLEACKNSNVKRFFFASSIYAYGNTGNLYTTSKISSELIIKNFSLLYNLNYTIFRYSSIFGSRNRGVDVISIFVNRAIKNLDLIINGDGRQTRNFIDVRRVAKFSLLALKEKYKNKTLTIASKKGISMKNLAKKIIKFTRSNSKIRIFKKLKRFDDFDYKKISKSIKKNIYFFGINKNFDDDLKNFINRSKNYLN